MSYLRGFWAERPSDWVITLISAPLKQPAVHQHRLPVWQGKLVARAGNASVGTVVGDGI